MKQVAIIDRLKQNRKEYILLGIAFLFFLFMALYKLTDAPIWLDEAWEFYFSRDIFGSIPGISAQGNLYERLTTASYQPPLYNVLMFVWLQFGESEWWFRFSGVVIGIFSVAGLYKCMKRISNYKIASLSIIIFSCIYQIIYYIQECAEYSLLVMFLLWTLYYYMIAMDKSELKNMILFSLFCSLSMYTQYGAAFVVIPLIGSLLLKVLWDKDWANLKKLLGIYAATLIIAGLPLIIFFLLPQLNNPDPTSHLSGGPKFYQNNIFADHLQMLLDTFRWNTIESMTRFYGVALIACGLLVLLAIYCLKFAKSKIVKHLIVCNLITWFSFYILTRWEIYAYGYFGARYNIFFIPLWLVTFLFMFLEAYQTLDGIANKKWKKISVNLYKGLMVVCVLSYCVYGSHQILKHWEKADTRGSVATWYDMEGYNITSIAEFGQAKSFTYYFEHDDRYQEEYEENVIREMKAMYTSADDFEQEYIDYEVYLDTVFEGQYPNEMYYFIGNPERCQVLKVLKDKGYTIEEVYRTTSCLYYLHKK